MLATTPWKRRFFTFWSAQAVSLLGSSLAQFALVWWLAETTGSATILAGATIAAILPGVLLGPFAGVLVDRWNRQQIIIAVDGLSALIAAGLAVLFWLDAIQIWHLLLAMAVRSLAETFHFTAIQSSTSLLVPEEQLARVAGLNQTLQGLTRIIAPPLGALLLSLLPIQGILGIDVMTAAIAVGLLLLIRIPQPMDGQGADSTAVPASVWADFQAGLRYIWEWPGLRNVLLIAALVNLFLTPAISLVPILVTEHFGGDAFQLATMNAFEGGGFVVGGILLSLWGGFKKRVLTSLLGLVGLGVGLLAIGLAPANLFIPAVIGITIVGMMMPIANGPFYAILQSVVKPAMQGRVFTVMISISMGLSPLGLAVAGPLGDWLGVSVLFVAAAVACLVLSLSILFSPALLNLEAEGARRRTAYGAIAD